jgi:ABC-type uncharacterized transport system substrate-binding protein
MSLKQKLKDIWYNLEYGPFKPEPGVQKELEKLGYQFQMAHHVTLRYAILFNHIKNAEGKPVLPDYAGTDEASEQYFKDYEDTVRKVRLANDNQKLAKKTTKPSFLDSFTAFFNDMDHGPYQPAPEVKKKLESLGYTFEETVVGNSLHVSVTSNIIRNSKGQVIGGKIIGTDQLTEQYYRDYDAAVRECSVNKPG